MLKIIQQILSDRDEKIIVVSQWTSALDIVGVYLRKIGIPFIELNGKTPIKSQFSIVQRLNSEQTNKSDKVRS